MVAFDLVSAISFVIIGNAEVNQVKWSVIVSFHTAPLT